MNWHWPTHLDDKIEKRFKEWPRENPHFFCEISEFCEFSQMNEFNEFSEIKKFGDFF